jgi:hypothetical protein
MLEDIPAQMCCKKTAGYKLLGTRTGEIIKKIKNSTNNRIYWIKQKKEEITR